MKFLEIGNNSMVAESQILLIAPPESAPIRRRMETARESGVLLDCTCGKRTRSVIVTLDGTIIMSVVTPDTLQKRAIFSERVFDGSSATQEP